METRVTDFMLICGTEGNVLFNDAFNTYVIYGYMA